MTHTRRLEPEGEAGEAEACIHAHRLYLARGIGD